MEAKVRRRLGDEAGDQLTVRTFHSLGMTIIGEAEGQRQTLAKVAEDDKDLSDLLKAERDKLDVLEIGSVTRLGSWILSVDRPPLSVF